MSIDKMRAEFIHAFIDRFGFGPMAAASNPDAAQMFEAAEWAWLASRAALLIELPNDTCLRLHEYTAYETRDVIQSIIESLGVKVKP